MPIHVLLYLASPWIAAFAGGVVVSRAYSKYSDKEKRERESERTELDDLRAQVAKLEAIVHEGASGDRD